jgi:GT2 family glycosyltransferase
MKKTFSEIYGQYITKKKENRILKQQIRRLCLQQQTTWKEYTKLTSVLSFKLWQYYNKVKRSLIKPIFLFPIKLTIVLIYILMIAIFFFVYKLLYFITYPFSKKLLVPTSDSKINGVSFIIPTWNKAEMVTTCVKKLSSLLEKEFPNIKKEVIVINNGSVDNTVELIESIKTSISIRLINLSQNLGFAKGINMGANLAKYNYLYLMNNDMIPKPNFFTSVINIALAKLSQGSIFFGITSQIFFFDKTKRREESGKTYIYPHFGIIRAAHIVNNINLTTPSSTCYPGGGSSLINKYIFNKFGGYDFHTYRPMYCEDLDLGFVAWLYGFPSYFQPLSHIIHHHRSSSTKISSDPSHLLFKNLLTFTLKNISSPYLIIKHIICFPIYTLINKNHFNYMLEVIPIIPSIFIQKISLLKYRIQTKDSDLIDFINFELKNG